MRIATLIRALARPRFSLRALMILVAIVAVATFVALNWGESRRDFLDWRAARAVRQRAEQVFREEAEIEPPAELVHILGSGALSHLGRINDIGLNAEQIISCGADRTVRCWSIDDGQPLELLTNVEGHIAAKSSLLVTIDDKRQARVYDAAVSPLKQMLAFPLPKGPIAYAFPSPVGPELAVVFKDAPNELAIFDLNTGNQSSELRFDVPVDRLRIDFREDGRMLAVSMSELKSIDARTGEVLSVWERPVQIAAAQYYGVVRLKAPWWLLAGSGEENVAWNEETHEMREAAVHLGGSPDIRTPGPWDSAWLVSGSTMVRLSMGYGDKVDRFIAPTTPVGPMTCIAYRTFMGGGRIIQHRVSAREWPACMGRAASVSSTSKAACSCRAKPPIASRGRLGATTASGWPLEPAPETSSF